MRINFTKPLAIAALLCSTALTTQAQTILRVKANATGANNGTSWADAYTSLQSAIATARANSSISYEIWVAGGTYKPTHDPSGNASPANVGDKTFYLVNGTKFYGGFAGTETLLSQRDLTLTANASILSGDLNSSNSLNTGDAFHVVMSVGATAATVLDGFTVAGGNATTVSPLTVSGQVFYRDSGGGMINGNSSPTISNCIITNNKSAGNGGGMFNINTSSPAISHTYFSTNKANYGAGMYNLGNSAPSLNYCTFHADTASTWGGGILNNDNSSPTISYCTFTDNTAASGGGIHSQTTSTITINNSTFSGNTSVYDGGAIYSTASSSPNINASTFSGNTATNGGGIFINGTTGYSIINCAIFGNKSSNAGAGVFLNTAQGKIINCTISGNMSTNIGGGLYYNNVAGGTLINSIIYGNTTPNTADANRKEIYKDGKSINPANTLTISYSIVKDYLSTATNDFTWGTGNDTTNPLFADPQPASAAPTTAGDYRLQYCSDAINNGDPQTNSSGYSVQVGNTDLTGNTRVLGATVDMGAYEKRGDLINMGNNAALSSSSDNGINLLPTCADNDGWTWYASPNNPDSVFFAIKWGTANNIAQATAKVQLTAASSHYSSTNGTDLAIVAMKRYWNVDIGTVTLAAPVSVRFLYNVADTAAMRIQAASLNVGQTHKLLWMNTTGALYNPSQLSFNNINNGNYTKPVPVYGVANGIAYVQFDTITTLKGGTAIIAAGDDHPLQINAIVKSATFSMYPNPANGSFTVTVKATTAAQGTIKIYDQVGRMVHTNNIKAGSNAIETQLNSGVYHVIVNYDGQNYADKLLIK